MPIDLFNPALAKERAASSSDLVGKFRSGYVIGDRPASLTEWRVTTGDPDVADKLHELLGGDEPQKWDTKGEDDIELFTTTGELDVILGSPDAVDARMLIWARGQKRIVTCEGSIHETTGAPYSCETGGFRNRREHEEAGHVCEPRISITFKLAAAPELGVFRFESGAWSLASAVAKPIGDLQKLDGPALCSLALERVEMKDGKSFTKPVLTVKGAAPSDD